MGKYYILFGCIAVLIVVLVTRESHFQYVRTADDRPIVVKDKTSTILFVGDIMLGRHVENLMREKGNTYPFKGMRDIMTSNHGVVANLEGPIRTAHVQTPSNTFKFSFASSTPRTLATYNVKVVSLANNHTGDQGQSGYDETRAFLDGAGIVSVGHPYGFGDEYVSRFSMGGRSYIFVGFNLTDPNLDTKKALEFVQSIDVSQDEYMIALIHGGDEYKLSSNTKQKTFYRGLIDAGVHLVIAHHPHVVEEIEQYKGKLIFYSLGNFIFDQYFSKDVEEGLTVRMTSTQDEIRYELIPIKGNHSQPIPMNESEKQIFLKVLADRSSATLKSSIEKGEIVISGK
ncbi:MAG: hypothetical protein K0S38_435 [Candidatus Paceibacter sp.]|jgi:poly-gamma-glutamate synthesis protein (capsule biosynthesis protein)|nr:hypothetical protein [Candidatus Paceibacter sp.]